MAVHRMLDVAFESTHQLLAKLIVSDCLLLHTFSYLHKQCYSSFIPQEHGQESESSEAVQVVDCEIQIGWAREIIYSYSKTVPRTRFKFLGPREVSARRVGSCLLANYFMKAPFPWTEGLALAGRNGKI